MGGWAVRSGIRFRIAGRSDPGGGLCLPHPPRAVLIVVLCLAAVLWGGGEGRAQGFAGLGGAAEGFAQPDPGRELRFPQDHGAHPDFRIEWWYVTANLEAPDGTPYGAQWTLFRSALAPGGRTGWESPQAFMGHAALTTPTAHRFAGRLARGGIGTAGVEAAPFAAFIDEWALEGPDLDDLAMRASGPDFAYDLRLRASGPLVLHGQGGYSVKSAAGQASRYYSQPFYRVTGTVTLPEGETQVTGLAWLDREWSSQPLAETQDGWDWFSLHLEDGAKLMAFRLRDRAGPDFTQATWIASDGAATPIPDGRLVLTPLARAEVAGRDLPVRWRVELPERGLDVTVAALNPAAMMETRFAYWEGPVTVAGSQGGVGYLEMTGY